VQDYEPRDTKGSEEPKGAGKKDDR
jgi:hypothetical protein